MGRIRRLSDVVANQIAAGEVVERPASVVKELVENSLDADAGVIAIDINDDRGTIEVRDDGIGMAADDLPRAIERHSTSKLSRIEDLEQCATLGFRGEALAAIASVSEVAIASRPRGGDIGHRLTVHFGAVAPVAPEAMNEGTKVRVAHLFHEQPGRLKALRTPAAEFGTIQQVVQQLAIGNPAVVFRLTHNGRVVIDTPGRGGGQAAVLAIFGLEVASDLIAVDYQGESGMAIHGWLAPAHRHRANRMGQALYVNRRWIANWMIRAAVEEAYRPNVPERRFPYFWLWLEVPMGEVDPNAHPTKAEVRLHREHALRALVHRLVLEALQQESGASSWSAVQESGDAALQTWDFTQDPAPDLARPALHQAYRELVPLAQWRAKYIVAQGPQGLCLIDQHAAHERIYFEQFGNPSAAVTISQPLLIPLTETLSAAEWAAWQSHAAQLKEWGFDIDNLGGTTIAVRAVPSAFHDLDNHQGLVRTMLELLSDNLESGPTGHPVTWAETARYAMAACKAAVKANRPMSMLEMESLLDDMSRVEDPRGCPHGRPTMVVLTLEEVDSRFGRRG